MLMHLPDLPGSKVLHVGAHDAEEHDEYEARGWQVRWVEAIPLKARALAERGLDVVEAAVWSEPATLTFHETNNGQSSSLLPLGTHAHVYPHITVVAEWTVETTTIDAICTGWQPDGVVLDIQGAELHALRGATRTLPGVQWIYAEVSTEPLYQGGAFEDDLLGWLSERGFVQSERAMTPDGWGDALWTRVW